jgi:hypothetical protein
MKAQSLPKAAKRKSVPRRTPVCHCRDCGNFNPKEKNNCESLNMVIDPEQCWARMSIADRMAVDQQCLAFLTTMQSWESAKKERKKIKARKARWAAMTMAKGE